MSITASEIIVSRDLGNGNTYIEERHTDSAGGTHSVRYVADSSVNTTTKLAEHAAQLAVDLAEQEATEVIG
jgi:hypothetical protein